MTSARNRDIDAAAGSHVPLLTAESAGSGGELTPVGEFRSWLSQRDLAQGYAVSRIPFSDLTAWRFRPADGNLAHTTGKFFTVEGLQLQTDRAWATEWGQPIIVQPEIGLLGIVVKRFGGVLHCLMQAKMEPGNLNGVQLSPTVQATRSNYTGVHGGKGVPYLEHFMGPRRGRVVVDALQSEQGAWYLHKRNRNMIVEVFEDLPVGDDFCWLTLHQIGRLLREPHVINMDSRTVLACIPRALLTVDRSPVGNGMDERSFTEAARHSFSEHAIPRFDTRAVLSWLTDIRAGTRFVQERIPLDSLDRYGWHRSSADIAHRDGKYFKIIAVAVQATSREVPAWTQPLLAPVERGVVALLAKHIDGVLHVLVQARIDAGACTVAELAATVQCQPGNYRDVPYRDQPAYLDYVLSVDPREIRYDVVHSEEGGRFYHAENRYMIIEVADDFPLDAPRTYHWTTLHQLTDMLMHSGYLNVELRTLIACIGSLS